MRRDIVIISEGGCMLGVFGAGVLTAFQEANFNKRVHSIYGSSAGAHNAAYFLSEQTRLGSSIYYEEMRDGFVKLDDSRKYIKDILTHRSKKNNVYPIIDIDYLIEVESKVKRLDTEKIKKHHANFYARVFDIENLKFEYIDAKNDIFQALKASSSASPYYPSPIGVNGKRYIDGSIIKTRDFLKIAELHQYKKIILILNNPHSTLRTSLTLPFLLVESLILGVLYGRKVMAKKIASLFNCPSIREMSKYNNVHVVAADKRYSKICTDKEKLLDLYSHGIEKGKELLKNLQVQND